MPTIRVELLSGRTPEQKAALAGALTAETVRVLGCRAEAVQVVFADVAREDWWIGGRLAGAPPPESPGGKPP